MMRTKVVITVDTEPSIAGAFATPGLYEPKIHEPVWGEAGGRSQALGFMLETLARHRLCATFFVETVHLSYFPDRAMGHYVDLLRAAQQDVQLHLHPCWLNFDGSQAKGAGKITDDCSDLAEPDLAGLIDAGRRRIRDWTGRAATSMRTGNFSVSASVYRAMKLADLPLSSNICIAIRRPAEASQDRWGAPASLAGGVHDIDGIIELPVTCFKDHGPVGRGRLRPLQITACSFQELRAHLMSLRRAGASVAVIMTHPFEFLQWSGLSYAKLRPNRLVQSRFRRLCAFLAEHAAEFEVVPIGRMLEPGVAAEPAVALDGGAFAATRRALANFINDRLPLPVPLG